MEPSCASVINSLFIKQGRHEGAHDGAYVSSSAKVVVVGLNCEVTGQLPAEQPLEKGVHAVLLAQSLQT